MPKLIYLDNAATTRARKEVVEEMLPYFSDEYGNPSSIYSFASRAKNAIDEARNEVAGVLECESSEIYFTSGGTEADNWAIKAAADGMSAKGRHIITSAIEHHAVLHSCECLSKKGFEITYLPVDEYGTVDMASLRRSIRPDTILISVMTANNEIGTIEPIRDIAAIARKNGTLFHTDAVQAFGHIRLKVKELGIDMLSASGHKINGPKGTGFLYVSNSVKLPSLLQGGAQEGRKRAGTENVPGIVGLGCAARIAEETMQVRAEYETKLRDYMIGRILREIPYTRVNGHRTNRLSNNTSFCFQFVEGESLLIMLDMKGICASSGSACTSGSLDPSHVLMAIGLPHEIAHGSLRLTLSHETTKEDIDYTVDEIKRIVLKLREMSPLYEDFMKRGNSVKNQLDS